MDWPTFGCCFCSGKRCFDQRELVFGGGGAEGSAGGRWQDLPEAA
jgi:hypothetical protein